jgi:hypothetical protein
MNGRMNLTDGLDIAFVDVLEVFVILATQLVSSHE